MDQDSTREVLELKVIADGLKEQMSSVNRALDLMKAHIVELRSDSAKKEKLTKFENAYKLDRAVMLGVGAAFVVLLGVFGFVENSKIDTLIDNAEVKAAIGRAKLAETNAENAAAKIDKLTSNANSALRRANNAATEAEAHAKQTFDANKFQIAKVSGEASLVTTPMANPPPAHFDFSVKHAWLEFTNLPNGVAPNSETKPNGSTVEVTLSSHGADVGYVKYNVWAVGF